MAKIDWGTAIGAGAGAIFDIAQANRNTKRAKEMAVFNREQQLKFWEDTNYPAQVEQMKKAGLNIGLMYEGGGQTGQTTGANAEAPMEDSQGKAMGIQTALAMETQKAQIDLIKAQAEKTKAEIPNVGLTGEATAEETRAKKYINDLNDKLLEMEERARNSEADARFEEGQLKAYNANTEHRFKHTRYGNEPTKAELEQKYKFAELEQRLLKAKNENNILEAETEIKKFEADMAKDGIPPNSPWYAKMLGDLLQKTGLMDWLNKGKSAVKGAVK